MLSGFCGATCVCQCCCSGTIDRACKHSERWECLITPLSGPLAAAKSAGPLRQGCENRG